MTKMKKAQIFSIIGGSAVLGLLMYRKQHKRQITDASSKKDPTLGSAIKNTSVSAKKLVSEIKTSLQTVEEITDEIGDFMTEVEPQIKKLTKDVEKMQK